MRQRENRPTEVEGERDWRYGACEEATFIKAWTGKPPPEEFAEAIAKGHAFLKERACCD